MKTNKIKLLSISLFYLVISLWSGSLYAASDEDIDRNLIDLGDLSKKMDLINLEDIDKHPHNAVLCLKVTYENLKETTVADGTGFLIGDQLVLTAAHVVFSPKYDFPSKIECYKGRHGGTRAESPILVYKYAYPLLYHDKTYEAYKSQKVYDALQTHLNEGKAQEDFRWERYRLSEQSQKMKEQDYALLYLREKINDIMSIDPIIIPNLSNVKFMFCGYPGKEYDLVERGREHGDTFWPYEIEAILHKEDKEVLAFQTPSYGGMSGSPVRTNSFADSQKWGAIAILSEGSTRNETSFGCRFTQSKSDAIQYWRGTLPTLLVDNIHNNTMFYIIGEGVVSPILRHGRSIASSVQDICSDFISFN